MNAGHLLLAGCRQEGSTEPVGPGLVGNTNGLRHFLRFVRSQAHGEHFSQGILLRETWPAHFLRHKKRLCVYNKCLTASYFSFTKGQVSTFETSLSSERVAGTAAGESELTNSLPVSAGASQRESEMKAQTIQVRSLAIEKTGDFFQGKIIPRIRIAGRWLEQAGFRPGHRVEIQFDQPGQLTLRFLEQAQEAVL